MKVRLFGREEMEDSERVREREEEDRDKNKTEVVEDGEKERE